MGNFITRWWKRIERSAEIKTEFINWYGYVSKLSGTKISNSQKRVAFRHAVEHLSSECYQKNFNKIMKIVQKKKENCTPYKNSDEQTNDIITWIPRMQGNRALVLSIIQNRRNKFGLVV